MKPSQAIVLLATAAAIGQPPGVIELDGGGG